MPRGKKASYVGTSILESLQIQDEIAGIAPTALAVLLAADLDQDATVEVLAEVYPEVLKKLEIATHLGGVLPEYRIAWLLDDNAPRRHEYL